MHSMNTRLFLHMHLRAPTTNWVLPALPWNLRCCVHCRRPPLPSSWPAALVVKRTTAVLFRRGLVVARWTALALALSVGRSRQAARLLLSRPPSSKHSPVL